MFRSFFFAGFECATGFIALGEWIDQIAATHHDRHVDEDYRRLHEIGICAVREAVRWPLIDQRGRFDFTSVRAFVKASEKYNMEVVWDLFHYGYPADVDLFSEGFPKRFAEYCHAAALYLSKHHEGPCYFTPVNEPSFFSWAAGEVGKFAPHCKRRGYELKVALARAGIAGINAIRAVMPQARIVNVDPLCHVVAPEGRIDMQGAVDYYNNVAVFESWDMLAGRLLPELGGSKEHLDIVGMNYYWTNQWELGRDEQPLADDDPRRASLRDLITKVWKRYDRPLLLTETAHVDDMRSVWVEHVAEQSEQLIGEGIPLGGVCLYPILGMPEWHDRSRWTQMGLWDVTQDGDILRRTVCQPMLEALVDARRLDKPSSNGTR
jgi:beta-glucosidase/6-phospho-beta-glucosidase/beta-galactosidase